MKFKRIRANVNFKNVPAYAIFSDEIGPAKDRSNQNDYDLYVKLTYSEMNKIIENFFSSIKPCQQKFLKIGNTFINLEEVSAITLEIEYIY